MKKIYGILGVFALIFITLPLSAQITVYNNTFTGSGGPVSIPGGTPAATYTSLSGNSDPSATSSAYLGGSYGSTSFFPDLLTLFVSAPTSPGTNDGFSQVTAPLSVYSAPFNSTLSANIGTVTWTFNMRTSTASTGFALGQDEAVTILAASNASVRNSGNGYAVAFDPGVAGGRGIKLFRYTGGLTGTTTTITSASTFLSSATNYASIKVLYDPATNLWTLFIRDDGSAGFIDPSAGVIIPAGSGVDATYTGTPMSIFGSYTNYSLTAVTGGSDEVKYGYFDNLTVSVTCPPITGGLSTCIGLTTTLSDSYPGGTWSSSTTAVATVGLSTGIVTGVATGTSTITYIAGVCSVNAVVTVNPLPAPPANTGVPTVCAGQTTTLSNAAAGTWSSGNTSIATVSSTGVVTGVMAGTVYISYTVPTGCFATTLVTVKALGPIIGNPTLCEGTTTTYNDIATGGTWVSGNTTVATIGLSTGFVTALTEGTSIVTYTTPAGCVATIIVTVNPLPLVATGTPTVCEGFTTTFTTASPDVLWSSSPGTIASVDDFGVVTGLTAGMAVITYKLPSSCLRTIDLTVNPTPSITAATPVVCVAATITLNATPAGGTWSSTTAGVIADVNATTGVVTGVGAGTSIISYIMPTGCFRYTTVTVNPIPSPITGTLSVCQGLTTTLSSGPSGTWMSSDAAVGTVSTAGVVTGISVNTVTITFTIGTGTGCYRTATVTVNALPDPITNTGTICQGATRTLSSTTTGGTWSSSNGNATANATTGVITGVLTGTSTITYTTAVTGCIATTVVTVIPQPAAFTGSLSVCMGSTTTLASTTSGVTWSSGTATVATIGVTSGVVTPVSPGTDMITGTAPNGCTRTAIVTVNPLPGNITGTMLFCAGTTTTLASTTSGGTWSSGNVFVASVAVPTSGIITGNNNGTANITYTLPTGCRRTVVVTVNPQPAVITGNSSVCLGLTTTLASTTTGGTWTSSDDAIAPVGPTTGVVSGSAVGTATISYTIANGCSRTRVVSVNPVPAPITGPTTVCPGTTITLSNATGGGTWSSTTPAIASVDMLTGVVTGVTTGTTTITYSQLTSCQATLVVTVVAAPIAVITPLGDTALCPGGFVNLTATTTPGVGYSWYKDGMAIPGALTSTYLTFTAGSYQVLVSVASGCSTLSAPVSVSVIPAVADITIPGGSASGCSGTGVELDGTVGTGFTYQWLLGGAPIAGATDITYTALTSGSYSLVISNSTGCSATSAAVAITVSSTPAGVVTVSGPLTICAGTHVTFTAAAGLTYQWFKDGAALLGATNATYNASAAGSYYVLESNTAGCSATSAASVVVVNPLPSAAISHTGSTVFCTGSSVALVAIPAGGSFQWYKGGVAIAGATNDTYIATTSGGYRVRVTDANGCSDLTHADTTVIVIGAVSVQPLTPATFCFGGSSLLSTNVSGAGSLLMYQWYLNSIAIPGATSPSYNATVPGSYSCAITVPGSCVVSTPDIPVVERPLPDPIVTFDGTLFHAQTFYVSYQWYKGLALIPGATTSSTPATSDGSYKVAVTDTNGCQSVSTFYVLSGFAGGHAAAVANVTEVEIKIYPNPANTLVHIAAAGDVKAVITGMDGRELKTVNNAKDIDISNLANGVYMIMVYDTNNLLLKTEKLVKAAE